MALRDVAGKYDRLYVVAAFRYQYKWCESSVLFNKMPVKSYFKTLVQVAVALKLVWQPFHCMSPYLGIFKLHNHLGLCLRSLGAGYEIFESWEFLLPLRFNRVAF